MIVTAQLSRYVLVTVRCISQIIDLVKFALA